jgi:RNA polymerase sigma-70 factor, ECF subfamily
MMTDSDRQQHDRFLRLFMGLEPSLRVFVRSLLFTREEERDVMQEVAVVLWRKFDPNMDETAFTRWAFGVARMEALTFRRDQARDRHCFGEEVFDLLAQATVDHADQLESERAALDICVDKLPPGHREVVRQAYAPGVRMDHLATQLGRTAMSLYKTLHRIRLMLLDCTRLELAKEDLT